MTRFATQWWRANAPVLEAFAYPERFPLSTRVGAAASEINAGFFAADGGFAFGLARILDGVERLISTRA